jgi:WD40 repeat protein
MFRWVLVCALLSAGAVALVWAFTPKIGFEPPAQGNPLDKEKEPQSVEKGPQPVQVVAPTTLGQWPLPDLLEFPEMKRQTFGEPIVIPGATLVIAEQQEVPNEKEGKLLFIGTDVQKGEAVPPEKRLPDAQLGFLAVPLREGEKLPAGESSFQLYSNKPDLYRRLQDTDQLEPNKIALARELRPVRKLQVGDNVKRGQLLALVNPHKAFDEVSIKVAKLNAGEADRVGSQKQRDEFINRLRRQDDQNRLSPKSVPEEEIGATKMQRDKHAADERSKAAEVVKAQRELNAALTDLKMHEIRAGIDGTVKVIYKNLVGDAVKPYEAVLQVQNSTRLRVEGLLEVQEALKLQEGMKVFVEASRPEHPRLVISGHLNTVTCVAVSKGKQPVLVSGSEDETLRGWDSTTGWPLWQLQGLKAAVRAVTCTPPGSKTNLVLFGCADGTARLFDLDTKDKRNLSERHQGAINGVAFSPDGEVCVTCGEDRSIRMWKTETGALLHILPPMHRNAVTSVQFASATRLVSAGRDNRLVVWDVEPGKYPKKLSPEFEGRGGEVTQVGVSPDGQFVLFDQGKELRLLSLDKKQIEGTVQNPSDAMNFSTMALFSPDGKTILTNASAAGKLQLWRTPATQARASELRQFIWMKGAATCGAFAPEDGSFAVTGTQDHQVLVWAMPEKNEIESRLEARLILVEKLLDTQSRQVRVWAELQNPGWLIPGIRATMVVPPQ